MAKKCVEHRNYLRIKASEACLTYTLELRKKSKRSDEEGDKARLTLNKRARNKSTVRVRSRCECCGRPRGVVTKFGLCRICFRYAVMSGHVPGMRKASW